jgi:molybdopterin biosynthesis enzyme MoaB
MLRESREYGPSVLLQRATGGVYNKCLVFALPRQLDPVRRALRQLVIPTMAEGVRIAVGPQPTR